MQNPNIVSIPFKRERIYKEDPDPTVTNFGPMFQFPSNGKEYTKETAYQANTVVRVVFPFPSNGNAETKTFKVNGTEVTFTAEFPFPSNGKAYTKLKTLKLAS